VVIIDQVTINPMRLEDIDSVLEIERMSFLTPWARDTYLHELKDNRLACYLVAWVFHRVLGYAGMWVVLDEAHVTTIAVDPAHRRRRIGERLLATLIGEAMRRRARRVTLEVRKPNLEAQSLYRKYGFKDIGLRKGYYSDNREDAIVMWTGNLWEQAFQERYRKNRASLDSPSA
jgi:[ribosomal protein S18]-alanine N-acetyltransferase